MSAGDSPAPGPGEDPALRAEAEARVATAPARAMPPGADALAHELHVHQVELEMQNEELRRIQAALEAARDRYLDLYDFAPVGYLSLDEADQVTESNLKATELLGQTRAGLVGTRFGVHLVRDERDAWHRHVVEVRRSGVPGRIDLTMQRADGSSFPAQIDTARVGAPGRAHGLRVMLADICERKRSEAELRLAAAAFDTQEGIVISNAEGVIERINRAFTRLTGYRAEDCLGQTIRLLASDRHPPAFYAEMWAGLKRAGSWRGEVWTRRKSGEPMPAWLTLTAVERESPGSTRYVGTLLDISQIKLREEEAARLAFHDPLTGLPNRRLLNDRLQQAMAVSARNRTLGALMFIDLDRFKVINDTLGHEIGDRLLQQAAQRLLACVREADTVARLGGDEFVVMLAADLSDQPELALVQARTAGEKILAALNRPYEIEGREVRGGVSIGITLFNNHRHTADELIKRADQAMYQVKATGRNALGFFDDAVQSGVRDRSALESELRHALRAGQLLLEYQPVVDAERRLVGAEALVRWQHPQRGIMLPDEFIGIAEESGLIHRLGLWVLEAACGQLVAWASDPAMRGLGVAVNVSAHQLRDPGFAGQVIEVLDRTGADPTLLVLELTEGAMLYSLDNSIAAMRQLTARGLTFALDDFGTGYGSLAYVKRLPLGQLKIDRSFVSDILTDPQDAAIASAILTLGQRLGLSVVAEGVQDEGQRAYLVQQGCTLFQGRLFGEAGPAQALRALALAAPAGAGLRGV